MAKKKQIKKDFKLYCPESSVDIEDIVGILLESETSILVNMSKYNLTVAILMSTSAVKNTDIFNGLFNPRYTYYRQLYNKSTDDYEYNDAFSIKQEQKYNIKININ